MCGGFVGGLVSDSNPLKNTLNPISGFKKLFRRGEALSPTAQGLKRFGLDYGGKIVHGAEDAQAAADQAAADAQAASDKQSAQARADAAAAYNADVIAGKRRRKAGSVLARSGAGVQSVDSVLAAAATYGKQTLGA